MIRWLLLGLLLMPTATLAAGGLQGRVAWRGQLIEGVRVSAYRSMDELIADRPLAVSAPTALDGTYRLELPPGDYYLQARDFTGRPQAGALYCYYSGSPVRVNADSYRPVGFNLIRIPPAQPPLAAKRSGLQGQISYQGEALAQSYLYIYQSHKKNFKGPAYFIQPVARGDFQLSLPPGEYYVLARKRARGGQFGPVEIDDYFNYYYANPVRIETGQVLQIELEMIKRLAMLEEERSAFQGIEGQIVGPAGNGLAGLRVFAYRQPEMSGMPSFFSSISDEQGRFELSIPEFGDYYLLARQSFGGPAADGELYGRYRGERGSQVEISPQTPVRKVRIDVLPNR